MRTGYRRLLAGILCAALALPLAGCVDQHPETEAGTAEVLAAETGPAEPPRIAATSVAVMQICEKLDLPLTGVPHSDLAEIPERYKDAVSLGSPMSPDLEILSSMAPDWVLSPSSLMSDLKPKYEAAGLRYGFLNLKSVQGMYRSIQDLGEMFQREDRAKALVKEFETYYENFVSTHQGRQKPRVLILMGLPGSYVTATENSYVGSLVELAGGINVYAGTEEEFLNVNTEDMLKKDPDIILRTAHALPDSVMEMFAEEFASNDIWQHFRAVECGQVYDLPHGSFGMSANFQYQEALEILDGLLYAEGLDLREVPQ